jgi:hypothetical protein
VKLLALLGFPIVSAFGAEAPFVVLDVVKGQPQKALGSEVVLLKTSVVRDGGQSAVREATVKVSVDGKAAELRCGNYELPVTVGKVQIDCPITGEYRTNSNVDHWGLVADARLRVWPAGSSWMPAGEFGYPVRQRWFLTQTQMSNEPTHADGGELLSRKQVYYHAGLDIGGAETFTEVIAATDGKIVSLGKAVLEGQEPGEQKATPVAPRYDVLYLLDSRGWYYRYSHLYSFEPSLKVGDTVRKGQKLGILGKEGGSGGWSHLHFEVVSRQPSGKWGTQEGYAFLWEAYLRDAKPDVVAVARPHRYVRVGEVVTLDGAKSYTKSGTPSFAWRLSDGRRAATASVQMAYPKVGTYTEILEVSDGDGHKAFDFASVNVYGHEQDPVTVHASYWPGVDIKPGMAITFQARSFNKKDGEEAWDFGDGSPAKSTKSDGNAVKLAKDGYARIVHKYEKPGDYIVTIRNGNATTRLWVPVRK